jgi:Zn-dependent protease
MGAPGHARDRLVSRSNALAVHQPDATPWSAEAAAAALGRARPLTQVPVSADLTCALGSLLTALTFAGVFLPETDPGQPVTAYCAAGIIGALGVVGSLLLHELGHAAAARWAGLEVGRIHLSFAGGLSGIALARQPRQELIVAIGGPVATVVAAIGAGFLHVVIVETVGPGLLATVTSLVAIVNVGFLAFHALPGLPLDGGHILHATVWAATRRPEIATPLATMVGRGIGDALLGAAVLGSIFGFVGIATWVAFLGVVVGLGERTCVSATDERGAADARPRHRRSFRTRASLRATGRLAGR